MHYKCNAAYILCIALKKGLEVLKTEAKREIKKGSKTQEVFI